MGDSLQRDAQQSYVESKDAQQATSPYSTDFDLGHNCNCLYIIISQIVTAPAPVDPKGSYERARHFGKFIIANHIAVHNYHGRHPKKVSQSRPAQ